jgi:hypothetical protein
MFRHVLLCHLQGVVFKNQFINCVGGIFWLNYLILLDVFFSRFMAMFCMFSVGYCLLCVLFVFYIHTNLTFCVVSCHNNKHSYPASVFWYVITPAWILIAFKQARRYPSLVRPPPFPHSPQYHPVTAICNFCTFKTIFEFMETKPLTLHVTCLSQYSASVSLSCRFVLGDEVA